MSDKLCVRVPLHEPLLGVIDEKDVAREQVERELTFWAHVIECAHDEETRAVALAGYQFAALQFVFGWL